jgi:hypothetical protein
MGFMKETMGRRGYVVYIGYTVDTYTHVLYAMRPARTGRGAASRDVHRRAMIGWRRDYAWF